MLISVKISYCDRIYLLTALIIIIVIIIIIIIIIIINNVYSRRSMLIKVNYTETKTCMIKTNK